MSSQSGYQTGNENALFNHSDWLPQWTIIIKLELVLPQREYRIGLGLLTINAMIKNICRELLLGSGVTHL